MNEKKKLRQEKERVANRKDTILKANFDRLLSLNKYKNSMLTCCSDKEQSCMGKYCNGEASKMADLERLFNETYKKDKEQVKLVRNAAVINSVVSVSEESGRAVYEHRLHLGTGGHFVEHTVCRSCFERAWGINKSFTDRTVDVYKKSQTVTGSGINMSARKNVSSSMVGLSHHEVAKLIEEALESDYTIMGEDFASSAMAPNSNASMLAYAYLDRMVEIEADQSPECIDKYMNVSCLLFGVRLLLFYLFLLCRMR